MPRTMEQILGAPIERERQIPGTRPEESEKVRYVSFDISKKRPSDSFDDVVRKISPRIPQRGGVLLDGCVITSPDGLHFYALVFHGDVSGWQAQIEKGAIQAGEIGARLTH